MHVFGLGKLQKFLHDVHCASLSINTHEHTLSTLIKKRFETEKRELHLACSSGKRFVSAMLSAFAAF